MRIGMMTDTYKPHISGITNYIELNKRHLEKAGHEVFVFTFGDDGYQYDEDKIITSRGFPLVDSGYFLSFRYEKPAKTLLQSMDIVHVHHPFLSGRLALRYCRHLNIPIVFTNHTRYDLYAQVYLPGLPEEVSSVLLESYMPDFCAAVDMVISPSAGMAQVLRSYKVEAPISIVPNGVELQRFFGATNLGGRERLGLSDQDILLIFTGRLASEKNLPFLLKAFSGVAQTLQDTHLLLVGDGHEREKLEEQVAQLGLDSRIHFIGQVSYDQLPVYLGLSDIFVTASVSEVHPLSVIEAMAAGLPVLGIQSVGVGDIVSDEINGLLSSNELAAFTAKMTRLCMDTNLRHKLGKTARKEVQRYDIEHTSQTMIDHYERLMAQGKTRKHGVGFRLRSFIESFKE